MASIATIGQTSAPAVRAAGARLVTLPISAGLALATSKIIIDRYGLPTYGVFALVIAMPALLPSRDLGLGAKVTDVVARRRVLGLAEVEETLAVAIARVAKLACGAVVFVIALQATIGWQPLLGTAVRGVPDSALTAAISLFLLALPGGLSSSVLWGLRRNDLIAVQAPAITLATLLGVTAAALLGWPIWVALIMATGSNCAIQWTTLYLVTGHLGMSRWSLAIHAMHPTSLRLRSWAVPMFIITSAAAIGYQTDRLVLSHTTSALVVGRYSVAAQLFVALWAVVSSAGYTLWGRYAVERHEGGTSQARFAKTFAAFAAAGLTEAALLTLVGPRAIHVVLGVAVPWKLCGAFGLLLAFQAAGLPLGMLMTDQPGLSAQAVMFSVMLIVNLWLSIRWAHSMGAVGPVLASAVAYSGAVFVPSAFVVRRYLSSTPGFRPDRMPT